MGKKSTNNRIKGLKRFFTYLSPFWGLFFAGFIAMVLATIARLSGPLILKALIDEAIPAKDTALMVRLALMYLGIIIVMGGLTYYQSITIIKLGLNVVTTIKRDLFSHLLTLPVSYFDVHPVGELMARVENDTEKVKQLFSETVIMLIGNAIYFVGMFVVFCFMKPMVVYSVISVFISTSRFSLLAVSSFPAAWLIRLKAWTTSIPWMNSVAIAVISAYFLRPFSYSGRNLSKIRKNATRKNGDGMNMNIAMRTFMKQNTTNMPTK